MRRKLTKTDLDPFSKTPLTEYAPEQRGWVAQARNRCRGNPARFSSGDFLTEECPECGVQLRVQRRGKGPILGVCPCGYEEELRGMGNGGAQE